MARLKGLVRERPVLARVGVVEVLIVEGNLTDLPVTEEEVLVDGEAAGREDNRCGKFCYVYVSEGLKK